MFPYGSFRIIFGLWQFRTTVGHYKLILRRFDSFLKNTIENVTFGKQNVSNNWKVKIHEKPSKIINTTV